MKDYTPCCVCLYYDACTARFKDSHGSFSCGDFEEPQFDDGIMRVLVPCELCDSTLLPAEVLVCENGQWTVPSYCPHCFNDDNFCGDVKRMLDCHCPVCGCISYRWEMVPVPPPDDNKLAPVADYCANCAHLKPVEVAPSHSDEMPF